MLIIGHRGAAGLAAENTISSLQHAVENKVDMVEVDLRLTKDEQIVLSHDPNFARTHDDRRAVAELTLEEVKAIGKRENQDIPTLQEFLAQAKLPVNLELKVQGMEEQVTAAIQNFTYEVLISSSIPKVLKKIRALDEKVKLGFIIGQKWGMIFPIAMQIAKLLDLYSVHPHTSVITPRHMDVLRWLKKPIYVWTVNDVHEYELMKGFGVSGVFTDFPNLIKA